MSDAVIQVSSATHDRLAAVAKSRGTSIGALTRELVETTLTGEEQRERAERTRAYLAEHFGVEVSDEESALMGRALRKAFAGQRDATT
ncbi:hypothetical protein JNUCC64_15240 [Streptomyces sp. JNUCC 64]